MKKGLPTWSTIALSAAYVSRKREILHSRRCKIILLPRILHHPFRKFHHSVRNYFSYDSRSLVRSLGLFYQTPEHSRRNSRLEITIHCNRKECMALANFWTPSFGIRRRGIPPRRGVMEHGVFRLHSSKSSWGRGRRRGRHGETGRQRKRGGTEGVVLTKSP